MKITVNTLTGECIVLDLDNDAKIGDLWTKLETALKMPADDFHISGLVSISEKNQPVQQRLCIIYSKDSADAKIQDFITKQTISKQANISDLKIHELNMRVVKNLGPVNEERIRRTPNGDYVPVGIVSDSKNTIFSSVVILNVILPDAVTRVADISVNSPVAVSLSEREPRGCTMQ